MPFARNLAVQSMNFSSTAVLGNDLSMSGAENNNQDGKHNYSVLLIVRTNDRKYMKTLKKIVLFIYILYTEWSVFATTKGTELTRPIPDWRGLSKASRLVCLGPVSMLVLYSFSRVSISLKWYGKINRSAAAQQLRA